ncbi:magnesium transporter [Entomomonas moraniae]|uniref:Magnesium transport protein CorA n=1 Tax=Entomomonas moraniae TaxID=2213226 RepID=A0A3S9XEU0_9GAMM|nr:magnesium transporter CorA family protein [Entomomonas moraniae]AZS50828.1 magnesium transporter [Entomomonas moraniae]
MITYHYLQNGMLKTVTSDEVAGIPKDTIWIDLLHPTQDEEHFIEDNLDIEVPSPEEMSEIEDSSRFFVTKDGFCMIVSVVTGSQNMNPVLTEISFILDQKRLVCAHYGELVSFKTFENKCARQTQLFKSPDILMMSLMDAVVDRIADILEKLQSNLNDLSRNIFDNDKLDTKDLQLTVKKLGKYNSLLAKLSDSMLSIRRMLIYCKQSVSWLTKEAKDLLRSIELDIGSLTEYHTRMSSEITFLLDATLGLINIEQNSIIKVFSIAAVLFLPPTLVGTIYGMNFHDMPELDLRFGYPLSLILMILSALICYVWFKIKKWL